MSESLPEHMFLQGQKQSAGRRGFLSRNAPHSPDCPLVQGQLHLPAGYRDRITGPTGNTVAAACVVFNRTGPDPGVVGVLQPDANPTAVSDPTIVDRGVTALCEAEDAAPATICINIVDRAPLIRVGDAEPGIPTSVIAVVCVHRTAGPVDRVVQQQPAPCGVIGCDGAPVKPVHGVSLTAMCCCTVGGYAIDVDISGAATPTVVEPVDQAACDLAATATQGYAAAAARPDTVPGRACDFLVPDCDTAFAVELDDRYGAALAVGLRAAVIECQAVLGGDTVSGFAGAAVPDIDCAGTHCIDARLNGGIVTGTGVNHRTIHRSSPCAAGPGNVSGCTERKRCGDNQG